MGWAPIWTPQTCSHAFIKWHCCAEGILIPPVLYSWWYKQFGNQAIGFRCSVGWPHQIWNPWKGCCVEVCGWTYVGSLWAVLRHPWNNNSQVKEIATSVTRQIGCSTQILHSGIVERENWLFVHGGEAQKESRWSLQYPIVYNHYSSSQPLQ